MGRGDKSYTVPATADTTRLAIDRTKLAVQRNILAIERTFSAWIRTGLAAVATGLGIARLITFEGLPWASGVIGAVFVTVGAGIFLVAMWRYYHGRRRLKLKDLKLVPIWLMISLTVALLVGAVLAFVFIVITY